MLVYKHETHDDYDFPATYTLDPKSNGKPLECEGVVYVVEHYRTDVVKAGSSYHGDFYLGKAKAQEAANKENDRYEQDEYCTWRARVVLKPVF